LAESDKFKRKQMSISPWLIYLPAFLLVGVGLAIGSLIGVSATSSSSKSLGISNELKVIGYIAGGLCLAIGSFAASAAFTSRSSVKDAGRVFEEELAGIFRTLNYIWIQLTSASKLGLSGEIEPETAFRLIGGIASSIQLLIAEIDDLSGEVLNSDLIIKAHDDLLDLAESIDINWDPDSEAEEIKKQELLQRITEITSQASLGSLSTVRIDCPNCQKSQTFDMSTSVGTTVRRSCSFCGEPFNTHRTSSGVSAKSATRTLTTRNSKRVRRQWECPNCEKLAVIHMAELAPTIDAVCLECLHAVCLQKPGDDTPDDPKLLIVSVRDKIFQQIEGKIVSVYMNKPVFDCEGILVNAMIRDAPNNRFVAICETHGRVLTVSNQSFRAWLDQNKPNLKVPYL